MRNRATWLPTAKAASEAFTEAGKKGARFLVPAFRGTLANCSAPETKEQDSEVTETPIVQQGSRNGEDGGL